MVKSIETDSGRVVTRRWERAERGSYCLMGTEFQIFKMKRAPDGGGHGTLMFKTTDPVLTDGSHGIFYVVYVCFITVENPACAHRHT